MYPCLDPSQLIPSAQVAKTLQEVVASEDGSGHLWTLSTGCIILLLVVITVISISLSAGYLIWWPCRVEATKYQVLMLHSGDANHWQCLCYAGTRTTERFIPVGRFTCQLILDELHWQPGSHGHRDETHIQIFTPISPFQKMKDNIHQFARTWWLKSRLKLDFLTKSWILMLVLKNRGAALIANPGAPLNNQDMIWQFPH